MNQSCMFCGSVGTLTANDQGFTCDSCAGVIVVSAMEDVGPMELMADARATEDTHLSKDSFIHVNKDRVVLAYVNVLQNCLIDHVHTLIKLGAHPTLEQVTRKIWIRTLEVSRVLSPGAMHCALQKFSPLLSNVCSSLPLNIVEAELEDENRLYDHYASYTCCLWRFLKLESVIWVLYASLVWMQEAIQPIDLTMWMETETLPFMKMNSFQERAQSAYGVNLPKYALQPKAIPRPLEIEVGAGQLAIDIGLELPPINVPLHIFRLCKTLDLSSFVAKQASILYGLYWKDTDFDKEVPEQVYYPQMIIGSCILASLKLNYGLDDADNSPMDKSSAINWMTWARKIWKNKIEPVRKKMCTADEMMEMSFKDLKEVIQFIDNTVMSGCDYRKNYEGLDGKILKLINKLETAEPLNSEIITQLEPTNDTKGVVFKIGDVGEYIPSLYLYPCRMYWFAQIGSTSLLGAESYCPFDYAAVLSVLSGILNIKPNHLEVALSHLEKDIVATEKRCFSLITGHKPETYPMLSVRSETAMIKYALQSMGLTSEEITSFLHKDADQINRIRQNQRRQTMIQKRKHTDDDLIDKAVQLYHDNFCLSYSHLTEEVDIPVVCGLRILDKDYNLHACNESPEAILHHACVSKVLEEPLVSFGAKFTSFRQSFYYTQVHNQDDLVEHTQYMSDVSLNDDDDECGDQNIQG